MFVSMRIKPIMREESLSRIGDGHGHEHTATGFQSEGAEGEDVS